MANNAVKTKNFSRLDVLRSLNLPFTIDPYSTLNEKFPSPNPAASLITPPPSGYPTIKYLAIGRGGHAAVVGSGDGTLVDILQHRFTDAVPFQQIPFVMVPVIDDLSPAEREKYRLRVLETYGGIDYFAYYLKVIELVDVVVEERIIQVTNGKITSDVPYVPSIASLSPTPVNISNNTVNIVDGTHFVTQAVLPVVLSAADIQNIVDACTTKYGDVRYATISEVCVTGGFDTSITTSLGGVDATYTELQTAQIMAFIGTLKELQDSPTQLTFQFALSNSSPYQAS